MNKIKRWAAKIDIYFALLLCKFGHRAFAKQKRPAMGYFLDFLVEQEIECLDPHSEGY